MKQFKKRATYLLAAATLAIGVCASPLGTRDMAGAVNAADFDATPLIVTTDVKRTAHEYLGVTLSSPKAVQGNALAVTVYVKNVSLPTSQISLSVKDSQGKAYASTTFNAKKVNAVEYTENGNVATELNLLKNSEFIDVPYGFYGTVYVPYTALNRDEGVTPADITSVSVGFGAQSLGYDSLEVDIQKVYVFGVHDVTLDGDGAETARNTLVDFSELQTSGVAVEGDTLTLSKASEYDMDSLENFYGNAGVSCKRIGDVKIVHNFDLNADLVALNADEAAHDRLWTYSKMGQTCEYSFETSGVANSGDMLKYTLGTQQDPNVSNVYSSLHFNLDNDAQDWLGAKGITCWVKNPASTEYSVGFEVFLYNTETETLEQYNLNSATSLYKTVYAYNTATGEEFSYNTQTFVRIPANFEGWLRIPFSQYDAPNWSTLAPYNNQGVFDTNKYKVQKISFSRLLKSNFGSTLYFDNLGVYYNDFSVGGLFETEKPSIKASLEGGN